jgi:hypothetical protein
MLRVRRRLWTPAHIRHLPTAYRFLKPPSPAFSTRDDASKIVENAPIELPPPPRSDDFASSVPSLEESTHVQLASSSSSEPYSLDSSPQTESLPHEPAPPMESLPHEPTPPPVQEPIPEPKDRSIKVGPSTTEELAKRLRLWSHLTKARVQERGCPSWEDNSTKSLDTRRLTHSNETSQRRVRFFYTSYHFAISHVHRGSHSACSYHCSRGQDHTRRGCRSARSITTRG